MSNQAIIDKAVKTQVAAEIARLNALGNNNYTLKTRKASKIYYDSNKNTILSKRKLQYARKPKPVKETTINCECKGRYTPSRKDAHEQTKQHTKYWDAYSKREAKDWEEQQKNMAIHSCKNDGIEGKRAYDQMIANLTRKRKRRDAREAKRQTSTPVETHSRQYDRDLTDSDLDD